MENRAILTFYELQMHGQEIDRLPDDQKALIVLLFNGLNEINFLLKFYISQPSTTISEKPAHELVLSTKLFLARNLSSKLFELLELVKGKSDWTRTKDPKVSEIQTNSFSKLEETLRGRGWEIAAQLRSQCTNHYSLKATSKALRKRKFEPHYTLYLGETEGNSYYPIGEELSNHILSRETGGEDDLGIWLDWTLSTVNLFRKVAVDGILSLLEPELHFTTTGKRTYYLDPTLVSEVGKGNASVFLRPPA